MNEFFLHFSDPHFWNHQQFSRVLPNGVNSRLAASLRAFEEMLKFGEENDIYEVCCTGDWWHAGAKLHSSILGPMAAAMADAVRRGFDFHIIPGNHDMASLDGSIHGLSVFRGYCSRLFHESGKGIVNVWDTPTVQRVGKATITFIPYQRDTSKLEAILNRMRPDPGSDRQILCIHTGIRGVPVGSGIVLETGAIDPGMFVGWNLVLAGHYHEHKFGDFPGGQWVIPGSFQQIDFSESGQKKGFLVVNSRTLQWDFREVQTPQFATYRVPSEIDKVRQFANFEDIYLRLIAENKTATREWVEAAVGQQLPNVVIDPPQEDGSTQRLEITPQTSIEEMISKFVHFAADPKEFDDFDRLIELGRAFLHDQD